MNRKYNKFLTITLIVIIAAVIGLLAYLGFNFYSNTRTQKDGEDAVKTFTDVSIATPDGNEGDWKVNDGTNQNQGEVTTGDVQTDSINGNGTSSNSKSVTKPKYKGYYMAGTIEIPKINLSYPILEKVTDKTLKLAVAIEWPQPDPVLNEIGNVVIAGHNYRNGLFFSNIKKLSKGDKIYITDLNKKRIAYIVYNIAEKSDTDTEYYNVDTNGKREITLKTCTDDATKRIFVQAREENT